MLTIAADLPPRAASLTIESRDIHLGVVRAATSRTISTCSGRDGCPSTPSSPGRSRSRTSTRPSTRWPTATWCGRSLRLRGDQGPLSPPERSCMTLVCGVTEVPIATCPAQCRRTNHLRSREDEALRQGSRFKSVKNGRNLGKSRRSCCLLTTGATQMRRQPHQSVDGMLCTRRRYVES